MQVRIGTSGYQYKQWKGVFYEPKQREAEMLAFYSRALPTVEINNTFYRMPKREVLERWASQVPDSFRFSIKAPKLITHIARLQDCEDALSFLLQNLEVLGDKLGVVLFQLPPFFKQDRELLAKFLKQIPKHVRVSFEFRHDSWKDDAIHALLREHAVALCAAETDEDSGVVVSTSDLGYLRLRKDIYNETELAHWNERIASQPWDNAYVFFKHEDTAPMLAKSMIAGLGRPGLAKAQPARAQDQAKRKARDAG